MRAIFADVQRLHQHAYVVSHGKRSDSFDTVARIDSILQALGEAGWGPTVAPTDGGLAPIHAVHHADMVAFLATAYTHLNAGQDKAEPVYPSFFPPPGQRRRPSSLGGQKGFYCVDLEVPIDATTWDAARASASCAWTGAQELIAGARCAYALCRPPGHHAGPDFMGGYCYLNNAAIAAQTLSEHGGRVAIVDIDYHHGNGTQAIFYTAPNVGYGSLHIDPNLAYPFFAGYAEERGEGAGEGTNWNFPLPEGVGDAHYLDTLDALLDRVHTFAPHWLVVSAGFDTYALDPIGTFQLTTQGFHEIGCRLQALKRPTLIVQEGGYNVPDLGRNVVSLLNAFTDFG